jgi:hypothetical protein
MFGLLIRYLSIIVVSIGLPNWPIELILINGPELTPKTKNSFYIAPDRMKLPVPVWHAR